MPVGVEESVIGVARLVATAYCSLCKGAMPAWHKDSCVIHTGPKLREPAASVWNGGANSVDRFALGSACLVPMSRRQSHGSDETVRQSSVRSFCADVTQLCQPLLDRHPVQLSTIVCPTISLVFFSGASISSLPVTAVPTVRRTLRRRKSAQKRSRYGIERRDGTAFV